MLLQVGDTTLNLDRVQEIQQTGQGLQVIFSGDADDCTFFDGPEADALSTYLAAHAIDALAFHATRNALVDKGLLPARTSAADVWQAAQSAFRRIANHISERMTIPSFDAEEVLAEIEQEAATLPGEPKAREVTPNAFSAFLSTSVAKGNAWLEKGGEK